MISIGNGASGRPGSTSRDPGDAWREPCDAWAGDALAARQQAGGAGTAARLNALAGTLEEDIIPRLVRSHASLVAAVLAGDPPVPRADEVDSFTQRLIKRDDAGLRRQLAALRAQGVGVPVLLTHLLAPAARHLGRLWEQDQCHFGDVTIGVARLQQIMRALSSELGTEIDPMPGGRRALLMAAPGEQHTFGLSMVGEFFARAGWEVAGLLDPLADSLQDKVANEWFDLVGISAGSTVRVAAVRDCVDIVRRHSHNRQVKVLVGGPLFLTEPALHQQVQADGVVSDGAQAPHLAAQLLDRANARRR